MRKISIFGSALLLFCMSFQLTPEHKKLYQARLAMPFGERSSQLEVYLFTDWADANTKEVEPIIERLAPEITKKAKLYFIDFVNEKTDRIVRSNVNYLLNAQKDLKEYFKFRNDLLKDPVLELNESVAANNDSLISGMKVASATLKNMQVTVSPTLLIYNLKTRQSIKIEGVEAISKRDILSDL